MVKKHGALACLWAEQRLYSHTCFEGLVYKKGKFSAIEEAQLNAAIENYRAVSVIKLDCVDLLLIAASRTGK